MQHNVTIDGQEHTLTDEHAASSHGVPVLVGPDGSALGPGDTCKLRVEAATDEALTALRGAGFGFDDCRPAEIRLTPLDVGFDLRAIGQQTSLPAGETLCVRYVDAHGQERTVTDRRDVVIRTLEEAGYAIAESRPSGAA